MIYKVQNKFQLQRGEDVFLFDDDIIGVVKFNVGGGVVFVDDFVTFFDDFDVGADRFDDGVGWFFFGFAEEDAGFSSLGSLFLNGDDAIL